MKVIVAGSRNCESLHEVKVAITKSKFHISELVCGCARGVDTIAEQWAIRNGIPVKRFPAEWDKYGKAAGPIRNGQMAEYADALVAVLYSGSRGTLNMIGQAKKKGLEVYVHEILPEPAVAI